MSAPSATATAGHHIQRNRKMKVVATLGPASNTPELVEELFLAGADVFRLNFSHGSHEDHRRCYDIIRALEAQHDRPIAVMADLQGPKLRIGTFAGGPISLEPGQAFRLDLSSEPGDATRVNLPHPEIFAALVPDTDLLLNDGNVRLHVDSCGPDFALTTVVSGRVLSDRKGVNVPGVVLPLSALTEKDRADLAFALDLGVDWVALSFVQRPEDLVEARKLIGDRAALLAKIEKPQAIDRLSAIIELADAIMLSAETAAGAYPVAAVSFMDTIAARVERDPTYQQMLDTQRLPLESSTSSDAITHAAKTIANALGAVAIITITSTGSTTLRAARERPMVPILCVTPDLTKTRKLMLAYGVLVSEGKSFRRFQDKVNSGVEIAQAAGLAKVGDTLVVTAGEGVPGSTNVLRVVTVEETPAH